MSMENIVDYVMKTPHNTSPAMLRQIIKSYADEMKVVVETEEQLRSLANPKENVLYIVRDTGKIYMYTAPATARPKPFKAKYETNFDDDKTYEGAWAQAIGLSDFVVNDILGVKYIKRPLMGGGR